MNAKRRSQARKRVQQLAAKADENPIELAKALWLMEKEELGSFAEFVKSAKTGRRKLYELFRVGETFGPLGIRTERLAKIGWLKLSLIVRYCEPGKARKALAHAEKFKAKDLPAILKGAAPPRQKTGSVLLRLNESQYKVLAATLQKFGARPATRGRGLADKEIALIRALRAARR
jgi:hypothetical protein